MPNASGYCASSNGNVQLPVDPGPECTDVPLGQFSSLRRSDTLASQPTSYIDRSLRKGDVLAGKYEFEEVLGTGAMGVVVAARHMALNERVAIKFLLPDVLQNPEAVARLISEARAAVRIKSEHVARVTDVGVFDDGAPFMVME
jgi:serine/threonine protein kinase